MAKKRRVVTQKEPEYEFVPPDFDEKEFILKDFYGTKMTLVVSLIAVVFGIVASFIYKAVESYWWGLLFMFAGLFALKPLLKLVRLDPDMLIGSDGSGSKSMLGNYFIYLFLCLAVWILLINPPFI